MCKSGERLHEPHSASAWARQQQLIGVEHATRFDAQVAARAGEGVNTLGRRGVRAWRVEGRQPGGQCAEDSPVLQDGRQVAGRERDAEALLQWKRSRGGGQSRGQSRAGREVGHAQGVRGGWGEAIAALL